MSSYIYSIFKRGEMVLAAGCLVVILNGCSNWLSIYPEDEIVEDEFWTSEDDVNSIVNSAYRFMLESDVLNRLVYMGEMR